LLRRGVDTRGDYLRRYEAPHPHGEPIDECLYLPNHPGLSDRDLERLVRAVRACCG
jgi:dTDP-4-amino-4,6-dideoxygalactose transaminase